MTEDIFVEDLAVYFPVRDGVARAVDNVTARFEAGKTTALIGESGCGKSALGLAILGLLPPYAETKGDIVYQGLHIPRATNRELRALRGRGIGFIPQSPAESLNPARRVGSQLEETLALTEKDSKRRRQRAVDLLRSFGFDNPERVLRSYPFELSGGMQQRLLCAIGVCNAPRWALADEPTKGLDRDLRIQAYQTLRRLGEFGVHSMLAITHDLEFAENFCDTIAVMYAGQIVEMGSAVLSNPRHPYTQAYLASRPQNGMHPIPGRPPSPGENILGCRFASRCPKVLDQCESASPGMVGNSIDNVRCFLYA